MQLIAELGTLMGQGARRFCDVGGGADPIVSTRKIQQLGLEYVLLDDSAEELEKAPADYQTFQASILDPARISALLESGGDFDVVTSRWTAEHMPDGRAFHEQVFAMLKPGGAAVHLFPTLYSPPFVVNRLLPDSVSSRLLNSSGGGGRVSAGQHPSFPRITPGAVDRAAPDLPPGERRLHGGELHRLLRAWLLPAPEAAGPTPPPADRAAPGAPRRGTDELCPCRTAQGAVSTPAPAARRVTLAHDYLLVMRGAERSFAAIAEAYPDAPIFTLLYDEQGTDGRFRGHSVGTSPLQRLGISQSNFRRRCPSIRGRSGAWSSRAATLSSQAQRLRPGGQDPTRCGPCLLLLHALPLCLVRAGAGRIRGARTLARAAAPRARPDPPLGPRSEPTGHSYIAISELSRERIKRYYGRDSVVIHPPVETTRFTPGVPGESLLVVSELVRHKRLEVALEAARRAGVPIRVVGSGPDHGALAEAFPQAEFLGRADDARLAELYSSARAVIAPSMEEFGIVAVEAQAAGRPVIAAAAGGALETVIDGETGRLIALDDVEGFADAIRTLDELNFDPAAAVRNAERFSVERSSAESPSTSKPSAQRADGGSPRPSQISRLETLTIWW